MKLLNKALYHLEKTKKMYLFLFLLVIVGVVSGSIFFNFINGNDKLLVVDKLSLFFSDVTMDNINKWEVFKNSYIINLFTILLIWILGISIIGVIINVFIVYLKGFMLGFIISSIIYSYKLLGLIGVICYTFPHYFINILIIIIFSYFSFNMSKLLIRAVVNKESINFKFCMSKYYKLLFFGVVVVTVSCLFEAFISGYVIKLFTMLLN